MTNRIPIHFDGDKVPPKFRAMSQANQIVLRDQIKKALAELTAQREEILKAFIAKHGFQPEEAIQIQELQKNGGTRWYVRKMTDDEIARAKLGKATQGPCS